LHEFNDTECYNIARNEYIAKKKKSNLADPGEEWLLPFVFLCFRLFYVSETTQWQVKLPPKEPNQMFQHKIPKLNPMGPTQNMKGKENL
jgi:hypothetical protein